MRYFTHTFPSNAVQVYLCGTGGKAINGTSGPVVAILEWKYHNRKKYSDFYMGPARSKKCKSIHHACVEFLGDDYGYIPIDNQTFEEIGPRLGSWIFSFDVILPVLIPHLRAIRIRNDYVDDEAQKFFANLGFSEFFPSRHILMTKEGRLPEMVEGTSSGRR